MDFPNICHKYPDAKIEWRYVWGRLKEEWYNDSWWYFHAVSFNIKFDDKMITSVHSSIHTIAPKIVKSEYSEKLGDPITSEDNWWHFDTDQVKIGTPAIGGVLGEYVYHMNHGRSHCSCPRSVVKALLQTSKGVWRHFFEEKEMGWADGEYSEEPWAYLVYKEGGVLKVNNWDWVAIRLYNGQSIMACNQRNGDNYCTLMEKYNGRQIDFSLNGNVLSIPVMGEIEIKPLVKEKIFHPEMGMKYSEVPIELFSGREKIGYGMRERTYGGIDEKSLAERM